MLNCKKYLVLALIFGNNYLCAMNIQHIKDKHVYDRCKRYTDVIKNEQNDVLSVIVTTDQYKNRKTLFPSVMTNDALRAMLKDVYINGKLCARSSTVKYIKHPKSSIVIAMAKDADEKIVTAYPILRYISLQEIQVEDEQKELYIATVGSQKISSLVYDLKKMAMPGIFLGYRQLSNDTAVLVTDISSSYTDELFFGVQNNRGSILIETLCNVLHNKVHKTLTFSSVDDEDTDSHSGESLLDNDGYNSDDDIKAMEEYFTR